MRAAIKVGAGREVVIPQKFHERLGLAPGDTLELTVEHGRLVLTPRTDLEKRLAESLEDFKKGRTIGPFKSAKEAMRALRKGQ